MNTHVNFEIAKMLKEKEYKEPSNYYYNEDGDLFLHITFTEREDDWTIAAPTISEVLVWLYEKHGIWIYVKKDWHVGNCLGFEAIIDTNDGFINTETVNSPTEAYTEAILYTLNNLIK